MRAWSLFRSNWKWLVIGRAQSSSFSYHLGHRRGLHCTIQLRTGIYPTFWHLAVARSHFKNFETWKRGLFHITKRAIVEQAASTEQNQSQVSLSLLLVHHILYSKLQGDGLFLCFKPWITLPSISHPTAESLVIAEGKNCVSCSNASSSGRYIGCRRCRILGCQMWK